MKNIQAFGKRIHKSWVLLIMLLPGFIFFIIFNYIPMYGILIAFKDYKITKGVMASEWVGFQYFGEAFSDPYFFTVLKNTVIISFLKLICGFPMPIVFALLLNEVGNKKFKKTVQTVSYLPYFLSWIILGGIVINVLSLDGPVNALLSVLGFKPKIFLSDPKLFRAILVITDIWKGFGWGSVIYLAALSGVNVELYEAAIIDGCTRFKRMIYITIPSLVPVIVILLILSCAGILSAGFDQVFNLYNPLVMNVADIIDTYTYRRGLVNMDYSYSTAIGIFKSFVGMILILMTNQVARKLGGKEYGLW